MRCCNPKMMAGPSGIRLRHAIGCKRQGQPYDGDRRITERMDLQHKIETAATGLELHPTLRGSSVRDHFNICADDHCELCAYVWSHVDDDDDVEAL